ncbi:MAG: ArsR/SmtB family transcription factor [Candidatus Thorarchaeota archaeon]|jgi:ArsR family transcriptional regulator
MTYDKETTWRINFHKALGNPVRLQIVDFLAKGEQCQCDIFPQIGLGQPTVSAYLTQMVRAGILKVRKDGTRKLYSIASPTILRAIESLRVLAEKQVNV